MEKEKIERISELTRLSRIRELTAEEKEERELLRNEYRAMFRKNVSDKLDNTYVIGPDGVKRKLTSG